MKAHVVARTYLNGFARTKQKPRGIVVFDKMLRVPIEAQVILQPVVDAKHAALVSDFYILERLTGPDDFIEQGFNRVENEWPRLKKALKNSGGRLAPAEFDLLALFVAISEAREPRNRLMLAQPISKVLQMVEQQERARGSTEDVIAETKRRLIKEDFFAGDLVHDPRNLALAAVPQLIKQNYEWFRRMNKMILTSSGPDFFTSDHPVLWFDPAKREENPCPNKLSLTAEVTFPLNRRQCLVMTYFPTSAVGEADEECVHVINARTALYALQQIYAFPALGRGDQERQLQHLTEVGFDVTGKMLTERYADEDGPVFDMRGLIAALGAEWEWFEQANLHIPKSLSELDGGGPDRQGAR